MELRELCGLDYVSLCAHEAGEESHEGKFVNIAIDVSQENSWKTIQFMARLCSLLGAERILRTTSFKVNKKGRSTRHTTTQERIRAQRTSISLTMLLAA